jgi:hypothetical protein
MGGQLTTAKGWTEGPGAKRRWQRARRESVIPGFVANGSVVLLCGLPLASDCQSPAAPLPFSIFAAPSRFSVCRSPNLKAHAERPPLRRPLS